MIEPKFGTTLWYRLQNFREADQAQVRRAMVEDEDGNESCLLPPGHRFPLAYLRVGKIHKGREGIFAWRRYLHFHDYERGFGEFRTDASGRGLWGPAGKYGPTWGPQWKSEGGERLDQEPTQLFAPDEFDLNTSARRALVINYHMDH